MACASVAFLLVGSLGTASASLTAEQSDKADSCISRTECPSGLPSQGTVLLQTQRGATDKLQSELPDLPPAFTAEMGSAENSSSEEDAHGPSFLQRMSPSAVELEHFQLLKDLRKRGFRCPGGTSYAAIADTESSFLFDCRLWEAARSWSSEMGNGNFFSHTQGGSNPCTRTANYGLQACGENIAAGNGDPEATLQQWMESDGHCVNMMNPQYNRFGVGLVEVPGSQYTHYWTQSLGSDSAAADQSCLANAPSPSPTPPSPSPAPPSPSPAPPSPSPVPGQVCEDKDVHCPTSYEQYCQHESAQTREHIQNTCPLTCGLCTA